MPPKKEKAPTKAELIKAQANEAKQVKEEAWPAYWAHRKDHILKGENKAGTPTGYHSKLLEGDGALCKSFGVATPIPSGMGCYKQWVAVLSNANPKVGQKTKESTFFPTTFTAADIEKVCKSAYMNAVSQDMKKNFTAIATVAPGNGMPLNFTNDSIYPQFDK